MVNELQTAFNEISELRALPADVVIEALQSALVSAYRRDSGASSAQNIEARIDPNTGRARIYVEKEVAESIISPSTEVTLEKARFYDPEAQLGDTVMVQVESPTKKFGRIAAQTAKQVILQKIREAERSSLYDEFKEREGDLITGTVQSIAHNMVTLSLGRAEAILPRAQQIPGERYRQHEKLRVYLMEVKRTNRGPQIVCSRSHRNMLRRLLEYEVPEIYNGQVEIKSIAREAGYRSKIAVAALQEGIDPVGACVGMRGIRIQNIVKELHDEKIDVIEWNPDAQGFIAKALSPARVTGVYLDEENRNPNRTAVVLVPDDQLSLAIGREGQNARLAAKLTGWRIDIKSVTETVISAIANIDLPPLTGLRDTNAKLIEECERILSKKEDNRTVMPEEYNTLGKFADVVERRLLGQRKEEREFELEQIAAVKSTIPQELFELPLDVLGALPTDLLEALEPIGNVGDLMLNMLVDEDRVRRLTAKVEGDAVMQVQTALDLLMELDLDFAELLAETTADPDDMLDTDLDAHDTGEPVAQVATDDTTGIADSDVAGSSDAVIAGTGAIATDDTDEDDDVLIDAFGNVIQPEQVEEADEATDEDMDTFSDDVVDAEDDEDDEEASDDDNDEDDPNKKKKTRRKRRRLVYDEETGEVVAKRRRKSNRSRDKWDDFNY